MNNTNKQGKEIREKFLRGMDLAFKKLVEQKKKSELCDKVVEKEI